MSSSSISSASSSTGRRASSSTYALARNIGIREQFIPQTQEAARAIEEVLVAEGTYKSRCRSGVRVTVTDSLAPLSTGRQVRTHIPLQTVAPPADEGSEVREAMERFKPELAEIVQLVHWDGFTLAWECTARKPVGQRDAD